MASNWRRRRIVLSCLPRVLRRSTISVAAASGASRRCAGLLLGVASAAALGLALHGPSSFSVVIDAGSTGLRVNVFRFDGWTSQLRDIGGAAQVWLALEPGISAFVGNASGLRAALLPLVGAALSTVPPAQRAATPLALRATGLRLLPERDAQWILDEARNFLEPYGFDDAGIRVMDGDEEGVCEWLTVNFLLGTFRPGIQAVTNPAAVVDLGGDSVQMAYLMKDTDAENAARMRRGGYVQKLALPFGSGFVRIYRHSYLGYGLMTARVKALDDHRARGQPRRGTPACRGARWLLGATQGAASGSRGPEIPQPAPRWSLVSSSWVLPAATGRPPGGATARSRARGAASAAQPSNWS